MEVLSFLGEVNSAWLALIGALLGGTGLKFLEHHLSKPKFKNDTATAFRAELREEVKTLRSELRLCEADADKHRDAYWKLIEENAQLRAALALNGHKVDKVIDVVEEIQPGSLTDVKGLPN